MPRPGRLSRAAGRAQSPSLVDAYLREDAVPALLARRAKELPHDVALDARTDRRRTARVLSMEDTSLLPGAVQSGNIDLKMDMEQAVASLPKGARLAFVLHDVEGYQHQEIAEQLSVSVGTVKAQLHRARRLLRERLEGRRDEGRGKRDEGSVRDDS